MTYESFVFGGRGPTHAHALANALTAYTAWLNAQRGPDDWRSTTPEPTIYNDSTGALLVTLCPPIFHDDPAAPVGCVVGAVAAMRLPARPVVASDE